MQKNFRLGFPGLDFASGESQCKEWGKAEGLDFFLIRLLTVGD